MHFPTFEVSSTNIFPLVNSTRGGQLATEYNLRSREMVATDPDIVYEVGPSFVHGPNDFSVSLLSSMEADDFDPTLTYSIGQYVVYNSVTYVCTQAVVTPGPFNAENWLVVNSSSSIIQVAPGRAVINGHYVQTLAPMIVDLALANAQLAKNFEAPLLGELTIGIKSYYSTENTMAGSMLVENEDNTYTGVQLVILKKAEFKVPSDSPTDRSQVTADLKLADFIYVNGVVASIVQNPNKVSYINSARIDDISAMLDENFISKKNLNPHALYTFSGQGGDTDKSTWCDSTGSLMVWDANPENHIVKEDPNVLFPQATFVPTGDGLVHLIVPHQQIDSMKNTAGENIYFDVRDLKLPKADYLTGTPGTVSADYTNVIKSIADRVTGFQQSPAGNMILYLERKDSSYEMPPVSPNYSVGDYIFVREDLTATTSEDSGAAPSTMYKVVPGAVMNVNYFSDSEVNNIPDGARLGDTAVSILEIDNPDLTPAMLQSLAKFYDTTKSYHTGDYAAYMGNLYVCTVNTHGEWDGTKWNKVFNYDATTLFNFTTYRGSLNKDYFQIDFYHTDDTQITTYYYVVSAEGPRTWSNYILVTGGIPLATQVQAGGFYNVDASVTDGGYITLDESGRLKLIDYPLLRQGTLAYQLGEDFTLPSNISSAQVQEYLDQYVNERIAFPFTTTLGDVPSVINVTITLPEESDPTIININDIDSRFGTAVYLHFLGKANSNTIINIIDCEKFRIDSNISGTPVINVVRSCVYYDANVFNYIATCDTNSVRTTGFTGFKDITLWYDKFSDTDADLQVNGMEISQPNAPMTTEDISFWNEDNPNDNHYSSALRSITLDGDGTIVACSVYVSNGSTATNITSGRSIIGGAFTLPQGSELVYPTKCLLKPLKVTGSFTTAYKVMGEEWVVIATNFTIKSGCYNRSSDTTSIGTIAFDSITDLIRSANMTMDVDTIDGWEPGSYHIFYGGTTI